MMHHSIENNERFQQRKAALLDKLAHARALVRDDIDDMKDDFKPFRIAGHFLRNMLSPTPEARMTQSNLVNFGLDTGVSLLVQKMVPGANKNVINVVTPVLLKNLVSHVLPVARRGTIRFLEWVIKKTEKRTPEDFSEIIGPVYSGK